MAHWRDEAAGIQRSGEAPEPRQQQQPQRMSTATAGDGDADAEVTAPNTCQSRPAQGTTKQ